MKRFLVLASVMMMAALSTGCKKDGQQSLAGTEWATEGGKVTLSFTSVAASLNYQEGSMFFYSYEYDAPVVMLHPEAYGNPDLKGTVSGNQMTLVNTASGQTIGFFNRQ